MQRRCAARDVLTLRDGSTAFLGTPVVRRRAGAARSRRRCPPIAARTTLVGIDLGTSNSAISVIDKGKSCILPDEEGVASTPSVVSYTQEGVLVGASAWGGDPANTFYSVKRLIGREPAEVAADVEALRYAVTSGEGEQEGEAAAGAHGEPGGIGGLRLRCPARGTTVAPEEVSAELLRHLLQRAEAHLGSAVTNAVVTVPAHFGDLRRKATYRAARLAGLQAVTLLAEPVAAAIAYGLGRPQEADTILVVDLGGGTLDISILESFEGIIEVLTTEGDSKLGGDDFDRAIATWALQNARQQNYDISDSDVAVMPAAEVAKGALSAAGEAAVGVPLELSMRRSGLRESLLSALYSDAALMAVMPAAEAAKVALSSAAEAAVSVPLPGGGTWDARLQREQFEALIEPLLRRMWAPLQRAGSSVSLEWAARPFDDEAAADKTDSRAALGRFAPPPRRITKALLVGGGTHIPAVQRLVQRVTGIAPDTSLDPEMCVAIGAGIQAGILEGVLDGPLEVMDGAYVQRQHGRATGTAGFQAV